MYFDLLIIKNNMYCSHKEVIYAKVVSFLTKNYWRSIKYKQIYDSGSFKRKLTYSFEYT